MSEQQMHTMQKEVHEISLKVAKGEEAHDNLKEMLEKHVDNFDKHVEKSQEWRDEAYAQIQAIANALLQDQTRDQMQAEQKKSWDNKSLVIWTTVVLAAATLLTNFKEVVQLCKNILDIL